ncbi:hypothetical protein MRX96_050343 [Rhipicephalus microplus]
MSKGKEATRPPTLGRQSRPQERDKYAEKVIASMTRTSKMPNVVPRDGIKIFVRRRGGLNIAKLQVTVATAIRQAAGVSREDGKTDKFCPMVYLNVVVVSTLDERRARTCARLQFIRVGYQVHEVLALLGECPTVCTVFPGLARDVDVTSSGWPNEGWFSSPVDDRCWIEETTPPFIIASTWNHCRLLVMACCSCGAITNASAAMTATRAHRFGNIMAGPSSSFWKASSARLVGDSMRVRPWNPPSGPRPLLDDYAGERLCHPMTTSAGHSLASDAVHQQWCLAPAALPVRPPTVLRMLRPGPRALAIPTRDCTYINRRDIIAAFSGSGGTIAMTPTHHTPLSFVQLLVMACCSCGAITNASAAMTATRAHRFGNIMAGPSSSFWKASSARLVGDSMRVRPWNPPSGPRPLLDDYAGIGKKEPSWQQSLVPSGGGNSGDKKADKRTRRWSYLKRP